MVRRGCGDSRVQDGLYLSVDTSPFGVPWENFLVDPAIRWRGSKVLRSPMILPDRNGVKHLCLGVGKSFYPFPSDFFVECKFHNLSKRIPRTFDFSVLDCDRSRLLLIHSRAIPKFKYRLAEEWCPKGKKEPHRCLGDTWALSGLENVKEKHEVTELDDCVLVRTPSVSYRVGKVLSYESPKYSSGIFMMFPFGIIHFEYVNRDGKVPPKLKKKIEDAGFTLEVLPE